MRRAVRDTAQRVISGGARRRLLRVQATPQHRPDAVRADDDISRQLPSINEDYGRGRFGG